MPASSHHPHLIPRREFLVAGSLSALLGSGAVRGEQVQKRRGSFGRARRCVLLFLTGGAPQHDTWDPKPAAPAEVRGDLKPIATAVPSLQFSELFPKLAREARRCCIVRSVTHHDTVHTSAGYTMLTGMPHLQANTTSATLIRPMPGDHPHVASMMAYARAGPDLTPPFLSLPEVIKDDAVNEYPGQHPGFLGARYGPFRIEADAQRRGFIRPEIVLSAEMTLARLADRESLRRELERQALGGDRAGHRQWEDHAGRAYALLQTPALRTAFELQREPPSLREQYGPHLFGQGALLARRLLEAGVTFVTVYWHYEGPKDSPVWDTHGNNFPHLRERLVPPTDAALSSLLGDLTARGMLDDTLVLCFGEFGRTPKINKQAGRDHWPHVQSILVAGAGTPAGAIYGQSDAQGGYPKSLAVTPPDLIATILHLLGISPELHIPDPTGRPIPACTGTPIAGLV